MPEPRLVRTRRTLPPGYQFGQRPCAHEWLQARYNSVPTEICRHCGEHRIATGPTDEWGV